MESNLEVLFTPADFSALPQRDLSASLCVVFDVLRATSTMLTALANGASRIYPVSEIAEALQLRSSHPGFLLAGERDGVRILSAQSGGVDFDLGNSPREFTPERVAGRVIIITTTNGTRAMLHARRAEQVLVASFVNAAAIVARLLDCENVAILCAGTDGLISDDDVLLAGLLVDRLQRQAGMVYQQNAQAMTARETWLNAFALPQALGAEPLAPDRLAERLRNSLGAKNLLALGLDADIAAAARIDSMDVVPRLDPQTFRIGRA